MSEDDSEIEVLGLGISVIALDARIVQMKEKFGKEGFQYGKGHPMMGQWEK